MSRYHGTWTKSPTIPRVVWKWSRAFSFLLMCQLGTFIGQGIHENRCRVTYVHLWIEWKPRKSYIQKKYEDLMEKVNGDKEISSIDCTAQ